MSYEKDQALEGRARPFQARIFMCGSGRAIIWSLFSDSANPKVPPADQSGSMWLDWGMREFPVRDEESIGVTCDRKMDDTDPQSGYVPGEKAMISVQAPFSGMAWVSIEAERVLETLFVPLDSNSSRFELPIKKEYGPNAWVTVYLLHPGGDDHLPAERFGSVRIKVRRPDLVLQVTPRAGRASEVQPKGTMDSGQIVVN